MSSEFDSIQLYQCKYSRSVKFFVIGLGMEPDCKRWEDLTNKKRRFNGRLQRRETNVTRSPTMTRSSRGVSVNDVCVFLFKKSVISFKMFVSGFSNPSALNFEIIKLVLEFGSIQMFIEFYSH